MGPGQRLAAAAGRVRLDQHAKPWACLDEVGVPADQRAGHDPAGSL